MTVLVPRTRENEWLTAITTRTKIISIKYMAKASKYYPDGFPYSGVELFENPDVWFKICDQADKHGAATNTLYAKSPKGLILCQIIAVKHKEGYKVIAKANAEPIDRRKTGCEVNFN